MLVCRDVAMLLVLVARVSCGGLKRTATSHRTATIYLNWIMKLHVPLSPQDSALAL